MNSKRILWLAAAVLWMAVIFSFSNQKAAASSEISGSLSSRVIGEVDQVFHLHWQESEIRTYAQWIEYPIRKAAHMTEYAILAVLLSGNFMQYEALKQKCFLWAFLGTAGYAATDEFHQLFIEGRSGEFKDVCIDSLGGLIGLILAYAVIFWWKKRRKNDRV